MPETIATVDHIPAAALADAYRRGWDDCAAATRAAELPTTAALVSTAQRILDALGLPPGPDAVESPL